MTENFDVFMEFTAEFADGERWKLVQADGWEDFQRRLAEAVGEFSVRRRQALMMLLFALVEGFVQPGDVREFMEAHDLTSDQGVEEVIAWLRERRQAGR
jgi:hypothetical protein